MKLTKEQAKGTQFEIWLEQLFLDLNYSQVRRNVLYHQSRYIFRQVDLEYRDPSLVIVEAKYSSQEAVRLKLRSSRQKSGQVGGITNIIEELEERRRIIGAEKALLITNAIFEKAVQEEAEKYSRVELYGHSCLMRLHRKRAFLFGIFSESIDEQIRSIELSQYDLRPKRVYLR